MSATHQSERTATHTSVDIKETQKDARKNSLLMNVLTDHIKKCNTKKQY